MKIIKKVYQWLMITFAAMFLVLVGFTQPVLAANDNSQTVPAQTTVSTQATASVQATSKQTASDSQSNGVQTAEPSASQTSSNATAKPATQPAQQSQASAQTNGHQITASKFSVGAENLATHQSLKNGETISQYTPIRINFNYDFTGQNVQAGDYFTFSFSPSLRVLGSTHFTTPQGLVQINGNLGRFTFQNQGGSDAHGSFYVSDQINSQATSTTVPIYVTINDSEIMRINVNYSPNPEQGPTEAFSKYTMNNNLRNGNIAYALRINASGQASYDDAVISDHLRTAGFTYDQHSFQIRQVVWTWNGSSWNNQTVRTLSLRPTFSADDTSFQIDFGNLIQPGTGYLVLYNVLYHGQPVNQLTSSERPAAGTTIENTASLAGTNHRTITQHQTLVIADYGGNGSFNNFNVTVEKTGSNGQRLANATFQVLQDGNVVATATTNANGEATFSGLHYGTYVLHESQAPAGYQQAADRTFTIGTNDSSNHNITMNVQDAIITTSATVRKVWSDANNQDGLRPTSVSVDLLANGQVAQTVTLTAADDWTTTLNNLPAYTSDGQAINYTWREVNVPTGYTSAVDGNVITNSHQPRVVSESVRKVWSDANNQDGLRPTSVSVELLANGQVVRTVELSAANNWQATINGLAANANGQAINYTWREANVPAGYTSAVDGNVITNSHQPSVVSESVRKVWNDDDNQDGLRPTSVSVELLANGQVVRTIELSAANNWQATINGLAANANGQAINYTWREANVPTGYTSAVDGNVITNSHQPSVVSESVRKVWSDSNNQDGLRPTSVSVELLANGQVVRTVELSAANNWQATINGLAANANGQAINYTWRETNVPTGYTSSVDGNVITNSHQPSVVSESVRKVWNDDDTRMAYVQLVSVLNCWLTAR